MLLEVYIEDFLLEVMNSSDIVMLGFDITICINDWANIESSLSYAFYKKNPEIIDYMLTADMSDAEFNDFEGFNSVNSERSSIIDISV
jgi:ppGpp synthetase/RelA/SpoT-type nucleotidyltranferase